MAEFQTYSPEDVIAKNLAETSEHQDRLAEQELAHLREWAEVIVADGGQFPDFIESLPEHRIPRTVPTAKALAVNTAKLTLRHRLQHIWKSVFLCAEIGERLQQDRDRLLESFFSDNEELPEDARDRIAYQRNSYADSAYLIFAEQLTSPRVLYSHNFQTVCEEVYNQNCEYCILPLENSTEGPLNSFFRLIERFELKIAATCDIPTTDGSRTTKFALLRRNLSPLYATVSNQNRLFEFSLPSEDSLQPSDVLYAAECCGLRLCRHASGMRRTNDTELRSDSFVIGADGGDLFTFLLFLAMEAPNYTPIGLYPHLDTK